MFVHVLLSLCVCISNNKMSTFVDMHEGQGALLSTTIMVTTDKPFSLARVRLENEAFSSKRNPCEFGPKRANEKNKFER